MKQIILLSWCFVLIISQLNAQLGTEHIITTGIQTPRKVASLHANADPFLDLIVRNQIGELSLLLGVGDGTFAAFQIVIPRGVNQFSLFDRDNDGDPDLLVAKDDDQVVWLENTEEGTFGPEQFILEQPILPINPIKFFDLDEDGDVDIIGGLGASLFWFENLGDDTYAPSDRLTSNVNGIRDFYPLDHDNDGDLDIIVTTSSVGTRILENQDNEFFSPPVTINGGDVLASQLVDLNGDGNEDLLFTTPNTNVNWLRNNGDGTFNALAISNSASWPAECHAADLDGDGDIDVLSGSTNDNKLAWYEQTANGSFGSQQVIDQELDNPIGIVTGDFFNGALGIMVISDTDSQVKSYRSNAAGNFTISEVVSPLFNEPEYLHFLDVNDDNINDIVFAANRNRVYAAYGNCQGQYALPIEVFTAPAPMAIGRLSVNDLDNDGDNDLVVSLAHASQSHRIGYSLFADGAFGEFEVLSYSSTSMIKIEELTGDEWKDILEYRWSGGSGLFCYVNQAEGSFTDEDRFRINGTYDFSPLLELADLDGDGDKDIVGTISTSATLYWTENLGDGVFAEQQVFDESNQFYSGLELSDADQDGDLDVFVYRGVGDRIVWFENTGDFQFETFHELDVIDPFMTYARISALDVNLDGLEDIVVHTDPTGEVHQFISLGNGEYAAPELVSTNGNLIFRELVADLDYDGDQDILFVDDDQHRVGWYENVAPGTGNGELNFTVSVSDSILCFGEQSASVTITPMPICGSYTIDWADFGAGDFTLDNLGEGVYTYTITAPDGLSATDSVVIEQSPELLLTGGATGSSTDAMEGVAWVSPQGGLPPYTFQWDDALQSTTDTVAGLVPGVYTVEVTDANDCRQSFSVTVDLLSSSSEPPASSIRIYPTIVDQSLYFATSQTYAGPLTVELVDLRGKTVLRSKRTCLANGDTVDLGVLRAGMYLLRIQGADLRVTKRIIKL